MSEEIVTDSQTESEYDEPDSSDYDSDDGGMEVDEYVPSDERKKQAKGKKKSVPITPTKSIRTKTSAFAANGKAKSVVAPTVVQSEVDGDGWTKKRSVDGLKSKGGVGRGSSTVGTSVNGKSPDITHYFSFSQKHAAEKPSLNRLASIKPGNGVDFFSKFLYKPAKEDDGFLDDEFISTQRSSTQTTTASSNSSTATTPSPKVKKIVVSKSDDEESTDDEGSKTKKIRMTKTTEEEEEEEIKVNKKPPVNKSKEAEQDSRHTVVEKAIDVDVDDDQETDDEKEQKEQEEAEEEADDEDIGYTDDMNGIERLMLACEVFSKKMLEILSSFESVKDNEPQEKEGEESSNANAYHKVVSQPRIMDKQTMRNYQLIGLNWLAVLYRENINGILADEMGLGKTVQTISMLAYAYENHNDKGPHLIVVPATTLSNWERELGRWCSKLKVFTYYGQMKEREYMRSQLKSMTPGEDYNVILTTYNILNSNIDRGFLIKKFNFSFMILDEAQNIKNADSKRYKNLFKLEAAHRLLLTGTPLQNNLYELWSLLNFLMPHIFGDSSKNNTLLSQLLEANNDSSDNQSIIDRMKKILSPFILRRLKSSVSQELMPKVEIIEYCKMGESQSKAYKELVGSSKAKIKEYEAQKAIEKEKLLKDIQLGKKRKTSNKALEEEEISVDMDAELNDEGGKGRKKTKNTQQIFTNILMDMRKLANHPLLMKRFYYNEDQLKLFVQAMEKHETYKEYTKQDIVELLDDSNDFQVHLIISEIPSLQKYLISPKTMAAVSAKCGALEKILSDEIKNKGSKVLVFSQMTMVLDILESVLDHLGYQYCRLDGQTPVTERQDIIDHFSSEPDIPVFLLSTLAGGLGINLTCANIVVFYDSSFNPQVDRQAEDRAHRLGQEKEVKVYKLIVEDTVDVYINSLSTQKKKLNDSILEEGSYISNESKLESKRFVEILDGLIESTQTNPT